MREARRRRSVDRDLPEVEAVVHEHRLLGRGEAGEPVRAPLRHRMVVLGVHEADFELAGEIRARAALEVEHVPLAVLLVRGVSAARAQRRAVEGLGQDLRALAAGDVDRIDVAILAARHELARVRSFVRRQRGGAVLRQLHGLLRVDAQAHDRRLADVPGNKRGARAILVRADLLLVELAHVLPVPDLHLGRRQLARRAALGCDLGLTLRDAEEQRRPVVGPGRRAVRGDAKSGRERPVVREIIYLFRSGGSCSTPGQHRVRGVGERAVRLAAHGREIGRVRAPRETGVDRVARVEGLDRPRSRVEHLDTVPGAAVDVDRHGEHRAVFAPRGLRDVAERQLGARLEVSHDHVGRSASARRIAAQRDVRSVAAQRVRLHVVERRERARSQVDDAYLVPIRSRAALGRRSAAASPSTAARTPSATAASTRGVRRDRVEKPAAVRRELRVTRRARRLVFVRSDGAVVKLGRSVSAPEVERHPFSVGRKRAGAKRLPFGVVGAGQRRLRGGGGGAVRLLPEKRRCCQNDGEKPAGARHTNLE